jgi:hypothetical protein
MNVPLHPKSLLLTAVMSALAAGCFVTREPSRASLVSDVETNPSRYVVVSIRNEPSTLPLVAGSSSRIYPSGGYNVAGAARRVARALERDYGLTETSAWPIPTLDVYCILLRISDAQGATVVIEQLRRDSRVNSVQALNEFNTLNTVKRAPR